MQVILSYIVCCAILPWHSTRAYRTDIDSSGEEAFCEHRNHLTFKPDATCCANKVVRPGLNISEHWDACVSEKGGQSDTVEGIGWDIYACILKKYNSGKDKLSLQEFADLITKNYPDDIKSKINSEIQTQTIPAVSIDDYARLEKLRVTYYDIEKEVCEGMPSAEKSYGVIQKCSYWKEENHRNGMCCKTSYPVDIRYKSVFDMGGDKTGENCRTDLHNVLKSRMLNATDMMEDALLDMCDVACYFSMLEKIADTREYQNFKVEDYFGILPNFIHPTMKEGAKTFLLQNNTFNINATIEDIRNFKFADVIPWESHTERTMHTLAWVHARNKTANEFSEFVGRKFHRGILHVPIQCTILKQVVTQAEHYIFQNCKPEDVTEAPLPAEPAKESKPDTEETKQDSTDITTTEAITADA